MEGCSQNHHFYKSPVAGPWPTGHGTIVKVMIDGRLLAESSLLQESRGRPAADRPRDYCKSDDYCTAARRFKTFTVLKYCLGEGLGTTTRGTLLDMGSLA
jgi:hypothetical protein